MQKIEPIKVVQDDKFQPQWSSPEFLAFTEDVSLGTKTVDDLKQHMNQCHRCAVRGMTKGSPMSFSGDRLSEFVFIGRDPQPTPDFWIPFITHYLEPLGLDKEEICLTSALACKLPPKRFPDWDHLAKCSVWKPVEFKFFVNVRYIFLLGNESLRQFFGPRTPHLKHVHGTVYKANVLNRKVLVIPLMHPYLFNYRKDLISEHKVVVDGVSKLMNPDKKPGQTVVKAPWA